MPNNLCAPGNCEYAATAAPRRLLCQTGAHSYTHGHGHNYRTNAAERWHIFDIRSVYVFRTLRNMHGKRLNRSGHITVSHRHRHCTRYRRRRCRHRVSFMLAIICMSPTTIRMALPLPCQWLNRIEIECGVRRAYFRV